MLWGEFERAAPELARLARERLDAFGVGLLGTVRRDGSPRISPIEPFLAGGHLLFGTMTRSAKARDLARDPRCVFHSVVVDASAGLPELKLYGRAEDVDDAVRASAAEAWWLERPREAARVLTLAIAEAVHVGWDLPGGSMTILRWTPEHGVVETTRPYP